MAATVTGTSLVGLRCRTSDRSAHGARGAEALAALLGRRLGLEPRLVGRLDAPRPARWDEDLRASRGCLLEAGGQVDDALDAGAFPILCAGDRSIALTTLPTVARQRPDARVLWLDAHGAFHTPETTVSGHLGGMALAGACGLWSTGFSGRLPAERVVLCGVRDLEAGERELLERSGATVIGTTLETLVYLQNALDRAPTYVHLDLDVLDPEVVPAQFPAADGLPVDKLYDLLDAVADGCEVVGLQVCGVEAPDDPDAEARLTELAARVVDPLLPGERDGVG